MNSPADAPDTGKTGGSLIALADAMGMTASPITGRLSKTTEQTHNRNTTPSSMVIRLTKSDKRVLDALSSDYAESIVTIFGKSLRLYRAIVEASEEGGSLIMLKKRSLPNGRSILGRDSIITTPSYNALTCITPHNLDGTGKATAARATMTTANNDDYSEYLDDRDSEAAIAVRDQFAERGKTPISLNRAYISPPKGLKVERIAIRANPVFMDGLSDLAERTGLHKSAVLRDSMHLYNFVKRRFEKGDATFYIGDIRVEGI